MLPVMIYRLCNDLILPISVFKNCIMYFVVVNCVTVQCMQPKILIKGKEDLKHVSLMPKIYKFLQLISLICAFV